MLDVYCKNEGKPDVVTDKPGANPRASAVFEILDIAKTSPSTPDVNTWYQDSKAKIL